MEKSRIQRYITNNSFPKIRTRALSLFASKVVKLSGRSAKRDKFTFQIKGSNSIPYTISVENALTNKSDIMTSCTCPYDHGGICKHTVAALLYIDNTFTVGVSASQKTTKTTSSVPNTQHSASTWMNLGNCQSLTMSGINKKQPSSSQSAHYNSHVTKSEGSNNRLNINVNMGWYDIETVNLKLEKDDLWIKCSCKGKIKFLCKHQYFAINKASDFKKLAQLLSNDKESVYNELTAKYGITKSMAKKCFNINTSLNGYSAQPTKEGEGLVPAEQKSLSDFSNDFLKSFSENSLEQRLIQEEKEISYKYAFTFCYYDNKSYPEMEILPLSAKLSAKNELTHLKALQNINYLSDYPPQILEELKSVEELNRIVHTEESEDLELYHDTLEQLVQSLLGYKYLFRNTEAGLYFKKADLETITLSNQKAKTVLYLEEDSTIVSMRIRISIEGKQYDITSAGLNLNYWGFAFLNNVGYIFESAKNLKLLQVFFSKPEIKISKSFVKQFLKEVVEPMGKDFSIDFSGLKSLQVKKMKRKVKAKKIYLSEVSNFILFKPIVAYTKDLEHNVLSQNFLFEVDDTKININQTDNRVENEFLEFTKGLHRKFENQKNSDYFYLSYDELMEKGWFFDAFEKMKEANIEIYGLDKLKKLKYSPHKASIQSSMTSGQDWFEVDIQIAFGDNVVTLNDIQKAFKKGENFVRLGDGTLGLLPEEWIAKMEKYLRLGQLSKGKLNISKLKFSVVDQFFDDINNQEVLIELAEKRSKLKAFEDIKKIDVPVGIKATLRDYQKEGLNWLSFLNDFKWGGILADDMGLGKTVQVLSFLQKRATESKKPSLVIIPTSLLFNWQHEIEKFTTGLKINLHYGPERERDHKHFKKYNVVISTYTTMINDIAFLRKYTFDYIILDESQAIKNASSQRYKAACTLKAHNRLALTGTPIENSTLDLYAQMSFLNPGFLGTVTQFKTQYATPIDRDADGQRAAELQQTIKPFILRRTKKQVAKELPPKTEDVIMCEMDAKQRKVYDAFRNKYRDYLLGKIEDDGLGNSKMYVLEGLTKLRQICDSPELLSNEEDYGTDSVKVAELLRHVKEKTGQHKILVFSQFVKMLNVIRTQLDQSNIQYEYLDGKSKQDERQASVEHFQNDDSCRVFLISLKAGGTGLNLTAADYVYLVDPWWNPAVENQAIDRSYRIGQDKNVFAYRMICKDTIEEKILQYQAKKKAVAEDIVTTDESFMKSLSKNDIEDLFS